MSPETKVLVIDLVAWIAEAPRPYADVMDAWRTSCPRLPVWEEANDLGAVRRHNGYVEVTDKGLEFLACNGRRIVAIA
tara:strand:- start:524 stop:757 length:234 start_codon:yes stop_codon:yes gene_type:complete